MDALPDTNRVWFKIDTAITIVFYLRTYSSVIKFISQKKWKPKFDNNTKLFDLFNMQKINYTQMIETSHDENTFRKTDMVSGYQYHKTFRNITDILTDCDKWFEKPLFFAVYIDTEYIERLDGSIRHLKAANSTPDHVAAARGLAQAELSSFLCT